MADTNMVMISQEAAKGLESLPFLKTFAAEGFFLRPQCSCSSSM